MTELTPLMATFEGYPHHTQSLAWWHTFKESGVLPYPGAYLEQPVWLLDDWRWFELLQEFTSLPHWIEDAKRHIVEAALHGTR